MKNPEERGKFGFTLVEMLIVMAMITLLATLSWFAFATVQQRGDRMKTKVELATIANGLEGYRSDHGSYPAHEVESGQGGSHQLHARLYQDGADGEGETYVPELDPASEPDWTRQQGDQTLIVDAWDGELRYRTGIPAGNPDFDLWSAGRDGESNPSNPADESSRDDIHLP